MRGFLRRRILWTSLLGAASVTLVSVFTLWEGATTRAAYLTGWLLFGVMVLLTGYNWFKNTLLAAGPLGGLAGIPPVCRRVYRLVVPPACAGALADRLV